MSPAARFAVVLGFLGLLCLVEVLRRGRRAERPRELAFLLVACAIGAAVGVVHDAITVTLSPEYFTLGKGLVGGPDLRARALRLGGAAGTAAGLIGGAVLLFAGRAGRRPRAAYRSLLVATPWILLGACVGAGAADLLRPLERIGVAVPVLDPAAATAFRRVWGIHIGTHAGGLLALVLVAVRLHRQRRQMQNGPAPHVGSEPVP